MTLADCYKLLELPDGASHSEVKAARRRLLMQWHPDKVAHNPAFQETALEQSKQINMAADFLMSQPDPTSDYVRQRDRERVAEQERVERERRKAEDRRRQEETQRQQQQDAEEARQRRQDAEDRRWQEEERKRVLALEEEWQAQWKVEGAQKKAQREAEAAQKAEQTRQKEATKKAKAKRPSLLLAACGAIMFIHWCEVELRQANQAPKTIPQQALDTSQTNGEQSISQNHYEAGLAYENAQNYPGAASEFQLAIADNPDDANSYYHWGLDLDNMNNLNYAIVQYRRAIAIDPTLTAAHGCLGNALDATGKIEQGIAEDKIAIQQDANNPHYHFDLGLSLFKLGDYSASVEEDRKALQLDNHNNNDFTSKMEMNLGVALEAEGQPDEAMAEEREAIQVKGSADATDHFNLGLALGKSGQRNAGIVEIQQALTMEPDNNYYRNSLRDIRSGKAKF